MILWKIWYDLRVRFFVSLAFVIVSVIFLIAIYPLAGSFAPWIKSDMSKADWVHFKQMISNYRSFIDQGWFREVKYLSALAVIFSLGGVMAERKTHSILFTLSLPVSRRRWLLSQSSIVILLITILCAVATLLILIGGVAYQEGYPLLRAMQGTLFLSLISLPWVGITFAVASLTLDRMKTALIVFCGWFFIGILNHIPPIRVWLPRHLVDYFMGASSFPWQALVVIFAAGIGGIFFAIQRFEKEDF